METKEKFWIYRSRGTVKHMKALDYGFIDNHSVVLFYDSKQQKYFRVINLNAIVYVNDPWEERVYIECKKKAQDGSFPGENYSLEAVPITGLFHILQDFNWQTGNYTTPVEIEVVLEPKQEEAFEVYVTKVNKEGNLETIYNYVSPSSPIEDLKEVRAYFSLREEYEKCVIIQKWIDAKTKRGWISPLFSLYPAYHSEAMRRNFGV